MEDKQTQQMTILAAVLVGLVLVIKLVEPPAPEDEATPEDKDLVEIKAEEVVGLTLTTEEGSLIAERGAAGWRLVSPIQAKGKTSDLDGLIELVDALRVGEPITGASPATYGLETPKASLTLRRAGGGELRLDVGADSPVGFKSYVRLDGGEVLVASGHPGETLLKPFAALRDDAVLQDVDPYQITRVRLTEDGQESWGVERREDTSWWLSDGRRASADRLTALVERLATLRFETFWEDLSPAEVGLNPPMATLTFTAPTGEITLPLGQERAGGRLTQSPSGTIGTIGELSAITPPLGELLEPRLVPLAPSLVDSLTVTWEGKTARWTRSGEAWTLNDAPDSAQGVGAISFIIDGQADRAARPAEPSVLSGRVEASAGEGGRLVILIGEPVEGGRAAREESGGPAFVVPQATIDKLIALPFAP
ncbi:MAG: hypothetical protein RIT28_4594 [Pseudomonadota bacterium]